MKLKHKITLVICLAFTSSFLFAGDGIQNEYLLETEEGYDLSQLSLDLSFEHSVSDNTSYEPSRITLSRDGETTTTFNFTGVSETFTVPSGVTNITIIAAGGKGGNGNGGTGGSGARIQGDFSVSPGQVITIVVGDQGQKYHNAGGGGGGTGSIINGTPLIISGGGGGAAINASGNPGLPTTLGGNSSGAGGSDGYGGQKGYKSGDV